MNHRLASHLTSPEPPHPATQALSAARSTLRPDCVWSVVELRSSIPVVRAHGHNLLPTYSGSNTGLKHKKATYLPRKGVTRGLGLVGASGPAHTGMTTLTHSQLLPASVHPVPARNVSAIEVKLLTVDEARGSLFNPLHARSRARLLATYLPTYRAPGRRKKATYLLFDTTGIELR